MAGAGLGGVLSSQELQILINIDSRQFGFQTPETTRNKDLIKRSVAYLERLSLEAVTDQKITIEPKTYCKIGHFNLLLEDYSKARSAYEKYYQQCQDSYWKDSPFLYGMGIVYFHYNSFHWAKKLFLLLLYCDPGFCRCNEANLRLAIIYKIQGEFSSSLKHYYLVLNDSGPCSETPAEVRFHIAHLHEVFEKPKLAKPLYEELLTLPDLSVKLKANVYRQLGWLNHLYDALGDKHHREATAIQCLQKSIDSDPRSGQSLYFLGRCFAAIGKVHDAFLAYRNSVDKSEGNADTWCSIGLLYQQQNQPLDALQAYICAVQLDKFHVAAWTNLGILYESVSQPRDSLACFVNASVGRGTMNVNLKERIRFLQKTIGRAPKPEPGAKPRQLPTIEEAWNLPISADMVARAQNFKLDPLPKKFKVEAIETIKDEPKRGKTPVPDTDDHEQQSTPYSPPFSPNLSDQELQAWLGEKNLPEDLNFDELDFEFNNTFEGPPPTIAQEPAPTATFNIKMKASELIESCKGMGLRGVQNSSILGDGVPPPSVPELPKIPLQADQLLPKTPSVSMDSKKEVFSPELQEFCLQHPIAVVKGMASALKLDLGLFSTKTLVESNPDESIEVRTQVAHQLSEQNWEQGVQSWNYVSTRSHTTILKYAQYQASTFHKSVREENERSDKNSDSDSKDSISKKRMKKDPKILKFGTNVDLSDEKKWKVQLEELNKIPVFAKVVSAGNMLTHVGHPILGMNTVQLYMKVPGSRTPGHQENNNFCSININIGPGDCEWFAVPDAYWGGIQTLCERNGINYLHGSWWPNLDDLYREKIPTYRFIQKPGDLVWVNSGCVHWVQSMGWCNNVAWNVGPISPRQYQMAIERYEWNKLQKFKSIVPMVHLSWNLARNICPQDSALYDLIKAVCMRTLIQCAKILEFVRANNVNVRYHGRGEKEASHYCRFCEQEVFNILFVKTSEKKPVVHCVDCARSQSRTLVGFLCLEEYKMEDLMQTYDNFVLKKPTPPAPPTISVSISGMSSAPLSAAAAAASLAALPVAMEIN